jgi:nucleotide-binding universal stress UspA family protein
MTFNNILVTTDFSPGSDLAIEAASALAKRLQASLHVLHVIEDPYFTGGWSEAYAFDLPKLRDELVVGAEQQLKSIAAFDPTVRLTTEVAFGRTAETIVRTAIARGTDLIVVGTHGRSGFKRMLMGSVAERVVRLAPCPVLVARDPLHRLDVHVPDLTEVPASV